MQSYAQVNIKLKNANSGFAFAQSYSNSDIKAIIEPQKGETDLKLNNLKIKTLVILGCNDDAHFLWVTPGDEIELDAETGISKGGNTKINKHLRTWKNEFLWNKNKVLQNNFRYLAMLGSYVDIDVKDMLKPIYLTNLQKSTKEQLKALKQLKCNDKDFTAYFQTFISNSYWITLVRSHYRIEAAKADPPEFLHKEILKLNFENEFLNTENKHLLLNGYIRAHEELKLISPTLEDYIYQKAKVIKNKELREYYVLTQLKRLAKNKESLFVESLFESSFPLIESTEGKEKYNSLLKRISAGNSFDNKPAHSLIAYDVAGNKISLEQFKGKYIYIDVWATWCGPCKQMTPHFMKLADQYRGKNIVFLSLSADKKRAKQKWEDYVNKHFSANCVATWTASGFDNSFVKHYQVNAIPRFMLIDPNGVMMANQFWNPMDPRVKTLFDKLLK